MRVHLHQPRATTSELSWCAESPERWGYAIRAPSSPDGNISAVPLPGADHFKLHVFGKDKGEFDIPPLIHDVMEIHDGLSYTDYYRLMSSMVGGGVWG